MRQGSRRFSQVILIRAPLVEAAVAAAVIVQPLVIQAPPVPRRPGSQVVLMRNGLTGDDPLPQPGPQLLLVQAQRRARPDTFVLYVRAPAVAAVVEEGSGAPQLHVVHAKSRGQRRAAGSIQAPSYTRAPEIPVVEGSLGARLLVVQAGPRPQPQVSVIQLRAPAIAAVVEEGSAAPQLHVIHAKSRLQQRLARPTHVSYTHPRELGTEAPPEVPVVPGEPPPHGIPPGRPRRGRYEIEPHVKLEREEAKKPELTPGVVEAKPEVQAPEVVVKPPPRVAVVPPIFPALPELPGAGVLPELLPGVEQVMAELREDDELVWLLIAASTLS